MNTTFAAELIREALMTAFWISLPLLAIGFVAGIVMSVIQIVTSIQDSSFGSVPRLAAFLLAFITLLPWMVNKWMTYASALMGDLGRYVR
ncbi:MAG TPA: flagellar biosynthetic protein FliQ [Bryobacteraceae bacterium]|jgi:flagellar biosynthetic protein FliQ